MNPGPCRTRHGVVPAALLDFLKAIGVRGDAVVEVAAALVSIQCEAARSLEIAKARANAALYALLGILQPGAQSLQATSAPHATRHARSVLSQ